MRLNVRLVISFFLFTAVWASPALAQQEVTIVTYYPAPYGEYRELRVSDNAYLAYSGSRVGIGTQTPVCKLHVVRDAPVTSQDRAETRVNASENVPDLRIENTQKRAVLDLWGRSATDGNYTSGALGFYDAGDPNKFAYLAYESNRPNSPLAFWVGPRTTPGITRRMVIDKDGNVGIGIAVPSERLEVAGNVKADNVSVPSSRQFKKDIAPLEAGDYRRVLDQIRSTSVFTYRLKTEPVDGKPHTGVIAEEAPPAMLDATGQALSFSDSVGFLLAGMKALVEENEALRRKVQSLEQRI